MLSKGLKKLLEQHKPTPGWLYGLIRAERAQQARWRRPSTPFAIGQKQVFLPNFTITLLRTPALSPRWAQFLVPLNLNKLDLRDYLYHAYNVRALSVRSFIKQQAITSVQRGTSRDLPGKRRQYRPRAIKKMTVELDKPFVWPEAPKDLSKWDGERFRKLQEEAQRQQNRDPSARLREAQGVAEVAQRLLAGKERWKGGSGSVGAALAQAAAQPGVIDVRGVARP